MRITEQPVDINNPSDVEELWKELKLDGEVEAREVLALAERNEAYYHGDHFADVIINGTQEDAWKRSIPKTSFNITRNLLNQYKARLTKDRPSVTAWAAQATPNAKAAAEVARQLIEYAEEEMQLDLLLDDVVQSAALAGTAGFKICFNPDTRRVEWYNITVFDFICDDKAKSIHDADWVAFRTYDDPVKVRSILGNEAPASLKMTGYNVAGKARTGVEVWELWHLPTPKVPEGIVCKIVEDKSYHVQPYSYTFPSLENPGEFEHVLPIVAMRIDKQRGTPYGTTWFNDVVPCQRQINEIEGVLMNLRRKTSNAKLVVETDAQAKQMTANNQIIVSPQMKVPVYMSPPSIPQLLFADRQDYRSRAYDLAGLNEELMGVASIKAGTAAKQIAYLNELDSMKHKGAAQSMETMLVRGWKLHLQLIQKYYPEQQTIAIVGKDDAMNVLSFRGADIQGVTVRLQPRAGLERMSATKEQTVEADVQAGLVDGAQIPEARVTASSMSTSEQTMRTAVLQLADAVLQGADLLPDQSIDAAIAVDELSKAVALLKDRGADDASLMALRQLLDGYKALLPVEQPQQPEVTQ